MKTEANKSLVAFVIALVIGTSSGYFLGVTNTRLDLGAESLANIQSGILEDSVDMATIERNAATVEVYPDGF